MTMKWPELVIVVNGYVEQRCSGTAELSNGQEVDRLRGFWLLAGFLYNAGDCEVSLVMIAFSLTY